MGRIANLSVCRGLVGLARLVANVNVEGSTPFTRFNSPVRPDGVFCWYSASESALARSCWLADDPRITRASRSANRAFDRCQWHGTSAAVHQMQD
jgi:hypothetical protein